MRKTFLKTIVATAVVGVAIALTSINAWAVQTEDTYYASDPTFGNNEVITITGLPSVGNGYSDKAATSFDSFTFSNANSINGLKAFEISNGGSFKITPSADGTVYLYAVAKHNTNTSTFEVNTSPTTTFTLQPRKNATISETQFKQGFEVTKNTGYTITAKDSVAYLYGIGYSYDTDDVSSGSSGGEEEPAASTNIQLQGVLGAKSLTLTDTSDATKTYKVEWTRDGSNPISLNDGATDNASAQRKYIRKISGITYGTYNVSVEASEYYTVVPSATQITINSQTSTTENILTLSSSLNEAVTGTGADLSTLNLYDKTANFDFASSNKNAYLNFGSGTYNVYSNDITDLYIKVNGSKFNSVDRVSDVQINGAETISVYMIPNSTVTFSRGGNAIGVFTGDEKLSKSNANVYTYTGTEAGWATLSLASGTEYVDNIKVVYPSANLSDNTYTSTSGSGLVVVKDSKVYAIGKIELSDLSSKDTVTLQVGNVSYSGKTEVFKQVKVGGEPVTGNAVEGVYYLGVKVNGVPSDAAAANLANLIKLA